MREQVFPIVSYAIQSRGPVLSGLMLDNGPALMASYLDRAGYRPIIFDFNNLDSVERIAKIGKDAFIQETTDFLDDYYRSHDVRIAGTKLYANGFADNVRIHKELKNRNPGLFLVGAGPHVSWFGKEIFGYTDAFNVLSYGDGDSSIIPIAELAYGKGRPEDIPGIIYKDKGGTPKRTKRMDVGLEGLPDPLYTEEFYPGLDSKIMIAPREDSRACPYGKCRFCVHPIIAGRYRVRSVEELAQEINGSGMRVSRLSGPSPTAAYLSELIRLISGSKLSTFGYSDPGYDYTEVSNGLMAVFNGLESTDRHILEHVLKKTSDTERYLQGAREMIRGLKENGVATIVSMMVPCPGETQETMDRNLEYLSQAQPDFVVAIPMGPLPGTQINTKAMKDPDGAGLLLDDDFERKMMLYELDLLRGVGWEEPPFKTMVNGEFTDPIAPNMQFTEKLMKEGMYPLSDEIVLMAYLYHNGLSHDQEERRLQCNTFMASARDDITNGNIPGLREKVERMNRNQVVGLHEEDGI